MRNAAVLPYESLEEVEAKLHKIMCQDSVKERDGQMEEIKGMEVKKKSLSEEMNEKMKFKFSETSKPEELDLENKTTEQLQNENEQLRKASQQKDKQIAELRSLHRQLDKEMELDRRARELSEKWLITSLFILIPSVFLLSTMLKSWILGILGYLIIGGLIFTSNNLAHKHLERKEIKGNKKI